MTDSRSILSMVARQAASAPTSPPAVNEKKTSSSRRMTSRRPTSAASGNPLLIPLPKHARSGVTPKCSWAPPSARRNPVTISSKTSSAP